MYSCKANSNKLTALGQLLTLLVTGLLVSGCVSSITTAEPVSEASLDAGSNGGLWSSPAGRMGVVPIMPPSEDVRVGDMHVFPYNPDIFSSSIARGLSRGLSASPRWATLNLLDKLEQEYQLRPAWPVTPDAYLQISASPNEREWAEPGAVENENIFASDRVTNRLRNIGIPEFSSFTLIEGDVNAMLPTEVINLVLGSSWDDDKVLTIRLNSAETYSLGLQKIIAAALDDTVEGAMLKAPYRDHLVLVADPLSSSVWIRVLSDVVYVRSIDFIIQSQAGFEVDEVANANEFVSDVEETVTRVEEASPATVTEGDESQGDEVTAQTTDEPEDGVAMLVEVIATETIPDHDLDPAYTAFVRAQAINQVLIESDIDDLPGGFLRFVSVTDDSVTVRRVWQRGLAVGARGLTLEVDKTTGEILRSGNMGTLLP
ncbi:hypothetical protein N8198_08550 [Gammaproteobacteria bacterium]|nr:hypothetical protein [Gammaproteobacteria bacterium]